MSKNDFDALLLKKLQEEAFEYNPESWKQLSERLSNATPVHEEITSFDTLLAAKLQEDTFEYNPASWNQLAEKLDNKAPENKPAPIPFPFRKWGIAIGTAAALFIVAVLAIQFNNSDNTADNTIKTGYTPAIAKNTEPKQQITPATEEHNGSQQVRPSTNQARSLTNNVPPQLMAAHQSGQMHNSNGLPNNPPAVNPVIVNNNQQPVLNLNNNNEPVVALTPDKTAITHIPNLPVIVKVQSTDVNNTVDKAITTPAKQENSSDYIAYNLPDQSWPSDRITSAPSRPKTNVSFGGGVNYGNINTGYTAGVSLKRKIGSDFFVDGTVAMMYNNNANNVAANNGPSVNQPSNTASKPGASTINSFSAPALDPIQKLYYVQMNPSFGYQIEDKVALSVGGDFQRMLNKKDEIVQPDNNNTKIFPTMDVGLTTKSEFIISPNLQAGLVYREGLNNIFKSDAPYVNRRYVQVQFKYNIPLK